MMVCWQTDFWKRTVRRMTLLVFCAVLGGSSIAQAQEFDDPLGGIARKPDAGAAAEFTASLAPATAKPGDEVVLTVTAKLPPHNYIYATTGDTDQQTQITVTKSEGLQPIDDEFKADREPEMKLDEVLRVPVSKFYDSVSWTKKFRLDPNATPEKVAVELQLQAQYCSEGVGGMCRRVKPTLQAALIDAKAAKQDDDEPAVRFGYEERPIRGGTNPALFRYQLAPTEASKGKIVKLSITMVLDPGWHTFPTTFEGSGGQPTAFTLTNVYGLKPIGDFKPNRDFVVKQEGKDRLEIYEDEVTWIQDFEVLPGTQPNAFGVEGKIKYQVCDKSCVSKGTSFSVGVTSAEMAPPENVPFFVEPKVVEGSNSHPQDKGMLFFLVTAIVSGFLALLTPCVFPMIPITVSFFLKQNEKSTGQSLILALVFSGSIVLAFVVLGVGVAAIFGATQLTQLATHWALNLVLASIFFAFALNMLGLFEIQMPSWLVNMTASGERTGGYVGVVFMALTFVLTSFSCTFAFVGGLLVAAAQGEYYWPIVGMTAFGATFASPFFLLAIAPGALKKLPKSGGWLNSVKVVMGFIEIGVAIKYISIVDQRFNSIPWLFDFTNVMILWSVLSFCTGLYLLGQFRMSHDTPVQGLSPVRVLLAAGFLMLGAAFAVGLAQPERESWLIDQLVSFAPARLDNVDFQLDFDRAVAEAARNDKPLFIDFTGVYCTNCRLMEKKMAKPHNRERLKGFVLVQLYSDQVPITDAAEAKRLLERNVKLQEGWFGDVTLPAYAIVTPDGKTKLASFLGLEQRTGDFAKFLDEGWDKWMAIREQTRTAARTEP